MTLDRSTRWKAVLGPQLRKHLDWYEAGRTGEGRLVLADEDLPNANAASLEGASVSRCNFTRLNCTLMNDIEATDCVFNDGGFNDSAWRRAKISRCRFERAWMGYAIFEDAEIRGGDWRTAYLKRTRWPNATVNGVAFDGAVMMEAIFENATFSSCTFWATNLSRVETGSDVLGRMRDTRFIDCDFRNANIAGMQMERVTFERCRFHGLVGTPAPGFDVTLIEPDFASTGEACLLLDPQAVISKWRDGQSADELAL